MEGVSVIPAKTSAICRTSTDEPVTLQLTRNIEQAPHITRQNGPGASLRNIGAFIADHLVGYIRILNTERAAKTATGLVER